MKQQIKKLLNSPDREIRLLGLSYLNQERIYDSRFDLYIKYSSKSFHSNNVTTYIQSDVFSYLSEEILEEYVNYCYEEKNY